jgi:hypothetical protein
MLECSTAALLYGSTLVVSFVPPPVNHQVVRPPMAEVTDQEKDIILKMLQDSEQLEARQASMAAVSQAEKSRQLAAATPPAGTGQTMLPA